MTRDGIIRMAIDAGINEATANFYCAEIGSLLAHEREECANLCEEIAKLEVQRQSVALLDEAVAAIRARGDK